MARLAALLLILSLSGAGVLAWHALNQPLQVIRVEGTLTDTEREEVRALLTDFAHTPVMSIDLAEVKARVSELSWPRGVTLRRTWPHSLRVTVDKEMLVARWAAGGFVSSGARIVTSPVLRPELPLFDCTFATPSRAMEVFRMLQELAGRAGFDVLALNENTLGEWRLVLSGGLEVLLGAEQLSERMHRFLLAWRRTFASRPLEYVDARYGNGVAVRWREPLVAHSVANGKGERSKDTEDNYGIR
ncbi:MAG: cell division protein FtsQ/DivIB [Pseudomonadales bacterium]|nr:cell division protein FtsQ/DivIB [Pseudomonadales bacterium]MDP6470882.1 cell division protein FtsQ/DivIB [Pseudomonadales bacterium]MDP6825933.1 cell division protein FtsQ/DivIB [Pseudomonadales bacterium]MDP6972245.1 cell division protein FtsQ/DivIB [Pseudomonadales bacterium]